AGMGKALAGASGNSDGGFRFFNLKDTARSVVIMIDVSASMFGRTGDFDYASKKLVRKGRDQEFQRIRDEAGTLIESLGFNTRFGLIHWSGSARTWKKRLVPATEVNKKEALEHLQTRVDYNKAGPTGGRPGGTRHDYALEEVLKLQPETVFMLTDGNATRSLGRGSYEVIEEKELIDLIEQAKKKSEEETQTKEKEKKPWKVPRINTIYYVTGKDNKEEERMLRSIARKTKGAFTRIDARPKRRARNRER
ncbi:MAG: VWA domain-containing protein, partial [Verrucomicrobiota bacterium]